MAYKDLSLKERHAIIRAGVANGIHRLADIEARYNDFTDPAKHPDYDIEAYVRENPNDIFTHEGHFTDKYKKPNHPTFSEESIYHSEATPGGHWSERNNLQRWNFSPSAQQISQPGYIQKAIDYLNSSESEGVTLTDSQGRYPSINGTIYGGVLPEVIVTPQYKEGGSIHIAPSKKGTFTAAATKHGKSVQAFARQVLAHKENYSPAMVKKAAFARASKSWKHSNGGYLAGEVYDVDENGIMHIIPNGDMYHSTGGPLYPFSFSKQPLPAVRYADGGLFEWVKGLFSPKDSTTITTEELQRPTPQGLNYAELRRRQAYIESGFDNNAKSKAGAVGMFQIIPAVLVDYNKVNSTSYTPEDLTDQTINTSIRDWYMDKLADRSWIKKGNANDSIQYAKSLAAYNFGPTATLKKLNEAKTAGVDIYDSWDWLQHMPTETQDYVNFILRGQNNSAHRNDTMYEVTKKAKSSVVKKL